MSRFDKITLAEVVRREKQVNERREAAISRAKQLFAQQTVTLNIVVQELKQVEAQEINYNGIDAQLKYIIDKAGVSFLEDIIG